MPRTIWSLSDWVTERISDEWLLSYRGQAALRNSALGLLFCWGFVLSSGIAATHVQSIGHVLDSSAATILESVLFAIGTLSGIFLYFGMFAFWSKVDRSEKWKKVIWFVLLWVPPFGALLYYQIVYRSVRRAI